MRFNLPEDHVLCSPPVVWIESTSQGVPDLWEGYESMDNAHHLRLETRLPSLRFQSACECELTSLLDQWVTSLI